MAVDASLSVPEKSEKTEKLDRVPVTKKDYLEQDPAVRGQNYVCLSFVSPENVIENKETFFVERFLESFASDLDATFRSLAERFKADASVLDMLTAVKLANDHLFDASKIKSQFDHFRVTNRDQIEADFHERVGFQTSIRGIKVRGTYETLDEAKARARTPQRMDDKFNVYVAQVGCWCPWDPKAGEIKDQEFAETELNTLVKGHEDNMVNARSVFEDRVHHP